MKERAGRRPRKITGVTRISNGEKKKKMQNTRISFKKCKILAFLFKTTRRCTAVWCLSFPHQPEVLEVAAGGGKVAEGHIRQLAARKRQVHQRRAAVRNVPHRLVPQAWKQKEEKKGGKKRKKKKRKKEKKTSPPKKRIMIAREQEQCLAV
jgi:hypothetical protein